MAAAYNELLDATIQHLEALKARGVRHVAVAPETLRALATASPKISAPPALGGSRRESAQTFQLAVVQTPAPVIQSRLTPAANIFSSPVMAAPVQSGIMNRQSTIEKTAAFAALRERAMACA
jgi:hypothetical protein